MAIEYMERVLLAVSWFCFISWKLTHHLANIVFHSAILCRCVILVLAITYPQTKDRNKLIFRYNAQVDSLLLIIFRPAELETSFWWYELVCAVLICYYEFLEKEFLWKLLLQQLKRLVHYLFNINESSSQSVTTKTSNNDIFSWIFAIQIAVHICASKLYYCQLLFHNICIMYVKLDSESYVHSNDQSTQSEHEDIKYITIDEATEHHLKQLIWELFNIFINLCMKCHPIGPGCKQYKMDARPKGMCVNINNRDFTCPGISRRDGTDEDVRKVVSFFKRCKFAIKVFENQTHQDMLEEMKRISLLDHRAYDCFVCFILSHGQNGSVYGTDGIPVHVAEIESFFSARQCRTLAKQPKLFFIQACQGGAPAQGVNVEGVDHEGSWECDVTAEFPVHEHADFLTVFATTPKRIAYRNTTTGSHFISTLIDVMDRCPGWSLDDIINKVRDDMDMCVGLKQIPETKSTLTKQVVLT